MEKRGMVECALMVADNGCVLGKQTDEKEGPTITATAEQALCGRGVR